MKNNNFGKALKELRGELKLSQQELGNKLEFSNQAISCWESGQREPDFDTLVKIAKFFDVTTDYLLGLSD